MSHKVKLVLPMSTMTPLVDAGTGAPGISLVKSCEDHQHPEAPARPTPVVSSVLFVTGDHANEFTITPPAGEGSSFDNKGTFAPLCPPTRDYLLAPYEQSSVPYYIQADGSLGLTPPVTSGEHTVVIPPGGTGYMQMQSAAIGLTAWPGGTATISVWAWLTGGTGGYYMFGMQGNETYAALNRGWVGGAGQTYTYSDNANLPAMQLITGTPQLFTFDVPVLATTGALATDWLVLGLMAIGSPGATLHIAYGTTYGAASSVATLFPPSGADYWVGKAKLPIISLAGVPGLLTWPSGALGFVVQAEVDGGVAGQQYYLSVYLLRVTGSSSSVVYQANGDWALYPTPLGATLTQLAFSVPVAQLSGVSSDQLAVLFVGTSDPGGVPAPGTTFLKLYYGGPDPALATQVQTLFGAPGGGGGISGRIHTPDVTVSIVSNTVTMGNSNSATVTAGVGPIYGVAIAGWNAGDVIWIRFANAYTVTDGGSPGTGFAPFALMTGGLGTPEDAILTAGSILGFRLRGDLSAWDEVASPAVK
jgi:hypothetical protein